MMVSVNTLLLLTALLSTSALAAPYSINYKNRPKKTYLRRNRNTRTVRKNRLNRVRFANDFDYATRPEYVKPDPTKNYRLFPLGWNSIDDFYPPYGPPYVSEVEYDAWAPAPGVAAPPPPPPPPPPYRAYAAAAAAAAAAGPVGPPPPPAPPSPPAPYVPAPYASGSSNWAISGDSYYYDDFVGIGIAPSIDVAPAFIDSTPAFRPYSSFDPYDPSINIAIDDSFRKVYNYESKTVEKWFSNDGGKLIKERSSYRDGTKVEKWLLEYGWFTTTWLTDSSIIQEEWNRITDLKKKFEYLSNGLKTETVVFEDGSKRKFKFTDDDMLISQIFVDPYGNVIEELSLE